MINRKLQIRLGMKRNNIFVLMALAGMGLPAMAQNNDKEKTVFDNNYLDKMVDVGADVAVPLSESTASVSIITSKTTDKRGARNIGNSIIGQGVGLQSLRKGGCLCFFQSYHVCTRLAKLVGKCCFGLGGWYRARH